MRGLGGDVTERIYEGMGHTVNADEAAHVGKLLDAIAAPAG
jgi:phospholipase/carboxylesterase